MPRKIFILFAILLFSVKVFSQDTYPIDEHAGETVSTCSGIFVDSGTDTTTAYSGEENYSVTFCSNNAGELHIKFDFIFFDLGQADYFTVYDGEDEDAPILHEAENSDLAGKEIWSSSECLHFHFSSSPSDHGLGWMAEIDCFELCEALTADVTVNGSETLKLCPDHGLANLEAEGSYMAENIEYDAEQFDYEWIYDGDVISDKSSHEFEFNDPGAYSFQINITDPVNSCNTILYETIQVGTKPHFGGTHLSVDTTCAEDPVSLIGIPNMTRWTGFSTKVEETEPIPDGTSGSYVSSLEFDVFDENDELLSEDDIDYICLTIDHVDQSQLRFELQCPDGSQVILKDYGGEEANLGEPVAYDDDTPGTGYKYCFTSTPEYGLMSETAPEKYEYTDNAGNYYANEAYLPAGQYTSYESLETLEGCLLNGQWQLTVTDNIPGGNGFISSWSLFFDDDLYPDSLLFTPKVVSETWYDGGTNLEDNPAYITKYKEGDYEFVFEIEDNFGCRYDTTLSLLVDPLPDAEITAEHEFLDISFCQGDSTILTVKPNFSDNYNWTYQWYLNNNLFPGRTYDTIVAKETGSYMVEVTDTITGCSDFINYELFEDNCELEIPNVFTPNKYPNAYFEIRGLEDFDRAEIVIYNRWGDKVFEHSDYKGNWWDGGNAPDGVYYFVISYIRQHPYTGQTLRRRDHGVVHIIR